MDEERDSHGRTREDFLADEADRKIKMLKESGEYEGWSRRLEDQAAYERDKRLFAAGDEAARAAREREQRELTEAYERGKRDA